MSDDEGLPPRKRLRARTRRLFAAEEQARTGLKSGTFELLAERFVQGKLSPQECQRTAAAVVRDLSTAGVDPKQTFPDLDALANLGSGGRHKQHCHADIMKILARRYGAVSMSKICVPVKPITGTLIEKVHLPMLEPHCTLEYLWREEPETFKKRICPSTDALEHFWNEMENHPQMLGHPVKLRRDYKHRAIPLSLHGDGVPATGIGKGWSQLIDVFSFSSLLGSGTTVELNMLIWLFFSSLQSAFANGKQTYDICSNGW